MTDATHRPHGAPPPDYTGPRRSLILAGGGMRVAYQAGVIRALLDSGLCFAHADGTSGGTINLAMLFSGLSPMEMCARWSSLNVKDFVSFLPLRDYLKGFHVPAMGDADGIIKEVFPHLGIDTTRINAAQGMDGTFNVCNYTRKTNEAIPHTAIDRDLLVAGISLPIFMPPVRKGDSLYFDSVWIKDANLMEAVRRGAEELWIVWCIGNSPAYRDGPFYQYVHMIEMSANGVLFEEFDRIRELNQRISAGERVYGHTGPTVLHLIKPEYPLPLDPDFYLGRIDAATLIDMGYQDAQRYLATMKPDGLPFEPEVTAMKPTRLGITFRETMAGGFALGETDPRAGNERGQREGTTLTMHATIDVQDLDEFIADAMHGGRITGNVSFPSLGDALPAKVGVFQLFSHADDPRLRYMVYELGFATGGKDYYLAGKKEVRDDPGFDLWSDTTTLYTRLHQGTDATGLVIGAGILRLGIMDLRRLVATMHAVGAESTAQAAEAVLTFGRFFVGELWNTYVAKAASEEGKV
jgi:predicted patatin/cPLA2 family phospholipase